MSSFFSQFSQISFGYTVIITTSVIVLIISYIVIFFNRPSYVSRPNFISRRFELINAHWERVLLARGVNISSFYFNPNSIFVTLFVVMVAFNAAGFITYSFPLTSSLYAILIVSIILWSIFMISSMYTMYPFIEGVIINMIPQGTPLYLTPFVMAIEICSSFVRPISLGVRISANITSGHLLMVVICSLILPIINWEGSLNNTLFYTYFFKFINWQLWCVKNYTSPCPWIQAPLYLLFNNPYSGILIHWALGGLYILCQWITKNIFMMCIPVILIIAILMAELAVCWLQAYVYTLLVCIYFNEAQQVH